MSAPKTLDGKIVLQAYMLDNSYKTLLVEPSSTVHDVCRRLAEMIGFSDPDDDSLCFGLCETHDGGSIIQRPLAPDREVVSVMENWVDKPQAKFVFQLKLYTETLVNSKDPKVIHMMFIQALHYIITGLYPTSDKDCVGLAALQFQAKFGKFNPSGAHRVGFLTRNLVEYIPGEYLQLSGKTSEQWEQLIFHKLAFTVTSTPRETYLDQLKKREYYGSSFFVVRQKFDTKNLPKTLYLAVSRKGILLLRVPATYTDGDLEVMYSFKLAEVYRWAYKPSVNFYFEVKLSDGGSLGGENNPVYTFDTAEGKAISDLLTDYAMALLREMGLNPDGTRRVRPKDAKAAEAAAAAAAAEKAAGGAAAAAGGGGAAAAPAAAAAAAAPMPVRSAMASSADAYKGVEGAVGSLASAATRSGEYASSSGSAAGSGGSSSAAGSAPPPPPSFAPPPPPTAPALPPNWTKVLDEGSGDYYFFNSVTGKSVWEASEMS